MKEPEEELEAWIVLRGDRVAAVHAWREPAVAHALALCRDAQAHGEAGWFRVERWRFGELAGVVVWPVGPKGKEEAK